MDLQEYVRRRFAYLDLLEEEIGFVPDELMKCLKRGAVWELAESLPKHDPLHCVTIEFWNEGQSGSDVGLYRGRGIPHERIEGTEPDAVFPHLQHLIESEPPT